MISLINKTYNQDIIFILLLISFFIIASLKGFYWKHTRLLLLGVFAQRYSNQFLREENVFTERVNLLTFIILIINSSILLSHLLLTQTITEIFYIIICLTFFYFLKKAVILFLGHLFLMKDIAKLLIFFTFLFDRVFAIVLFPLLLILNYFYFPAVGFVMISIFMIVIITLVLKIFWLWKIGAKSFGLSQFYIFLYLCMLEIIPLLILVNELDN